MEERGRVVNLWMQSRTSEHNIAGTREARAMNIREKGKKFRLNQGPTTNVECRTYYIDCSTNLCNMFNVNNLHLIFFSLFLHRLEVTTDVEYDILYRFWRNWYNMCSHNLKNVTAFFLHLFCFNWCHILS